MEFRILGPVEVWNGAQRLDLGGLKPRALLAVLLLDANRVVSTDRVIDQLWGEAPPSTARNLVQAYVSRLRQALHQSSDRSAAAPVLATRPSGYLLQVEPSAPPGTTHRQVTRSGRSVSRLSADHSM